MNLSFVFWNKVLEYSAVKTENLFYAFSGKCQFLVESYMIRIDFTDLSIENIIVATSSSKLFFSQILVFFQDYSSDSRL